MRLTTTNLEGIKVEVYCNKTKKLLKTTESIAKASRFVSPYKSKNLSSYVHSSKIYKDENGNEFFFKIKN